MIIIFPNDDLIISIINTLLLLLLYMIEINLLLLICK